MSAPSFKNESVSSNSVLINNIPIANGVPSSGSTLSYDRTKNQWTVTPGEYILVQGLSQGFGDPGKNPLLFNLIKEDKTQTNIAYDLTTSKWTLQPGTYRFSIHCPSVYVETVSNPSDISVNIYVSYTSIKTGVTSTLKETGAYWRSGSGLPGFTYAACNNVASTLIIEEPVEAEITVDLSIVPLLSSFIAIGNGIVETGNPTVLVEQVA